MTRRKAVKEFALRDRPTCLATNLNDSFIAAGCKSGSVFLLNSVTNNMGSPMSCGRDEVSSLRYSTVAARVSLLAASSLSGGVTFFDCNTDSVVKSFAEHSAPCTGVAFSPINGSLVLSCGLDKKCVFYDIDTKRAVKQFIRTDYPLTAVELISDGRTVVLGSSQGKVLFYDLRNFSRPLHTFEAHPGTAIRDILCQPTHGNSVLKLTSTQKSTRSRSKLSSLPLAAASAKLAENKPNTVPYSVENSKENMSPPPIDEDVRSPGVDVMAGNKRDSFSSQVFSPLRNTDLSPALSMRSNGSVGPVASSAHNSILSSGGNVSNNSLFSPLREQSFNYNSSLVGEGIRYERKKMVE